MLKNKFFNLIFSLSLISFSSSFAKISDMQSMGEKGAALVAYMIFGPVGFYGYIHRAQISDFLKKTRFAELSLPSYRHGDVEAKFPGMDNILN